MKLALENFYAISITTFDKHYQDRSASINSVKARSFATAKSLYNVVKPGLENTDAVQKLIIQDRYVI